MTSLYLVLARYATCFTKYGGLVRQVGARWLSEWCHRAQTGAGPGGSSDDALALAVSRVLLASRSADEAAAELFDLLGDGSFDAIQQLLEHRYLPDFLN